jgi:radical SAM/Cys-rich protein
VAPQIHDAEATDLWGNHQKRDDPDEGTCRAAHLDPRDPLAPGPAHVNDFESRISAHDESALSGVDLAALVVSVTLRCNQACMHCHVRSSPSRDEMMGTDVMMRVVEAASAARPSVVDVTGGAPELNPRLPHFLRALRAEGHRVQLRTNLTVLEDGEHAGLADTYAASGIELLASMPCYTERNVGLLRGPGVRDASVRTLLHLNALGYGSSGGPRLDLIYNPVGTTLPESQPSLEALFREELAQRFGIVFTHLLTMTNMPVGRFRDHLVADGGYDRYVHALREAFNPDVVPLLQCRHQIEVGWDGRLYDCDFNLGEGTPVSPGVPATVWEFDAEALATRRIAHGAHCFGCTAGAGSS